MLLTGQKKIKMVTMCGHSWEEKIPPELTEIQLLSVCGVKDFLLCSHPFVEEDHLLLEKIRGDKTLY